MWQYLTLLIDSSTGKVTSVRGEAKGIAKWQIGNMFFPEAFDYLGYLEWRLINVVNVDLKLYAFFEKFVTKE